MELEEQQVLEIEQRLLDAHFSNQGLQYLIEEAATALGNPIVVVDPTYRYIAYHLGDLADDSSQLAQVMREEIAHETMLEEAVAYIRDSGIDSAIAKSTGPLEQHNEMLGCTTMTLAVMVHGVCIAHVMMMDGSHPFGELDRQVFVRLANFIGQEMQKSELWSPTSGELGSYFLESLLSDRSPSDRVTRRRMKAVNFHPKPLMYVVCLHAPGEGLSQMAAERVAGHLRPLLHHALYTRHHQQLVLLITREAEEGFSEKAAQKIREVAALNGLTAGVSNTYTSITETNQAYTQARSAIRYGEALRDVADDYPLFRYCDYTCAHLLEVAGRRMNLLSMVSPDLMRLLEHDQKHKGELMETLFCYLQTAGSTARAAQILNLHKNTMLYRLGRIKELLGRDLTNGEDIFVLQLSFRILMGLGQFKPQLHMTHER